MQRAELSFTGAADTGTTAARWLYILQSADRAVIHYYIKPFGNISYIQKVSKQVKCYAGTSVIIFMSDNTNESVN